eukprot:2322384-Amphidinium_carterae.2
MGPAGYPNAPPDLRKRHWPGGVGSGIALLSSKSPFGAAVTDPEATVHRVDAALLFPSWVALRDGSIFVSRIHATASPLLPSYRSCHERKAAVFYA